MTDTFGFFPQNCGTGRPGNHAGTSGFEISREYSGINLILGFPIACGSCGRRSGGTRRWRGWGRGQGYWTTFVAAPFATHPRRPRKNQPNRDALSSQNQYKTKAVGKSAGDCVRVPRPMQRGCFSLTPLLTPRARHTHADANKLC